MSTHECKNLHAYSHPEYPECPVCGEDLEPSALYRQYLQVRENYDEQSILLIADASSIHTAHYVTFDRDLDIVEQLADEWPMRVTNPGLTRLILDLRNAGYRTVVADRLG